MPVQQSALVSLTELFHSPQNVSQGISEGIVKFLIQFLSSVNITCRQKSAECLKIMSNHAIGREAILEDPDNLAQMTNNVLSFNQFDDSNDLVRKNIHDAFANVSSQEKGVKSIFDTNLFSKFIAKIKSERLDIQIPILATCYNCIRMGSSIYIPFVAIQCGSLAVFTQVANVSTTLDVQVAACQCIMMLWY